ncbi:MAG: D-2-hydroxyacid dehydrogenase [Dehalococcoidia bacterium]|nr:D-2-hydroxyacid dehydrogenase [Dehalococcoidia bacterium]
MKVVVTSLFGDGFEDSLTSEFPSVEFVFATSQEDQAREIKDADAYLGAPNRDVFLAADHLRWLHCPGTGIDKLTEIPEIVDSDVVLTNARGPHAAPMADHVISMCLAFAHRTNEMVLDQKAHVWDGAKYDRSFIEMEGTTMGILALGDIGSGVARRAMGFGMEVYAVDRDPFQAPPGVSDVWGLDRLNDLLQMSDWFVVTAPYTVDSKGMIGAEQLALMKSTAHLIIISRGGIVDEDALFDVLSNKSIAGAGIDAFEVEPLPEDSPWWDLDNVIISPHSSALTVEMWEGRREIFRENLRRFLANEPFIYVCDKTAGF